MGRLVKCRRVAFMPEITYFSPVGASLGSVQEVCLSVEEVEALRLKDLEGLGQKECAERMQISRPTFHRVLGAARQKVAEALMHGRAIRIEGGKFEMAVRRFYCLNGHEWDVPFETMVAMPPRFCPKCNSSSILPIPLFGWGKSFREKHRGGKHRVNEDEGY